MTVTGTRMDNIHLIITRIESTAAWHRWKAEGSPDDPPKLARGQRTRPARQGYQQPAEIGFASSASCRARHRYGRGAQVTDGRMVDRGGACNRGSHVVHDGAELLQAYATEAQRLIDMRQAEPLNHQVDRLSDRLSNHVDANCDAIA